MDGETWGKVVKFLVPGIIKMKVIIAFFNYFIIHVSNSPYPLLKVIFILYMISLIDGHSSHITTTIITWLSLKASFVFRG